MASAVSNVVLNPPTTGKYTTLKDALLKFYRTPPVKQIMNFIQSETQTDLRPREIAKDINSMDAFLEQYRMALFTSAMPSSVQAHLLARHFKDIGEMADTAESLTSQGLSQ